MTTDRTSEILLERSRSHGDFTLTGRLARQALLLYAPHLEKLDDDMFHSLDMILVKIARILSGNHGSAEHWEDIAGYATLIARRLTRETGD